MRAKRVHIGKYLSGLCKLDSVVSDHRGSGGLNADQSRRDQAAGPGIGWPQHPLTPCTSIVPVDDRFLGGTGSAPPSDCPWCSPSLGTVYARGHQTVRPVQLYYLSV